ncbi:OmpA family protein [Lysobacter auxotrophicus]|uniref:OmpA-like domain-containing protein n=1 Tax=Lysobacter auxotrophicus TaxID=2992573 RepID=A0ABN6UPE6_9GAMM|nr:OmpA family protein [Lysobacter auxotrophicus]BDU16738.1 hypothetical protein LA521A_19390 [Lysobacter auxotrophicus]
MAAPPITPYDELGLDAPFAESDTTSSRFETTPTWSELETPYSGTIAGEEEASDTRHGEYEDEGLAWLDVEAESDVTTNETLEGEWSPGESESEADVQVGWSEDEATPAQEHEDRQRLPTPVDFRERAALELDGFPEYITDITPAQRKAIEDLAIQIIRSNETSQPIYAFRVEGFADIARRIPDPKERKWFEDGISKERAENGFTLLVDALRRKGGNAIADRIARRSTKFGLGSQRLKVPNAKNEAEFRRNRRVVFIVRQVTFIPPPPKPPERPSSVIEDRFSVQLLRAATIGVSVATGVEVLTVAADLQIVDHMENKRAVFKVETMGGGFGIGPTKLGGSFNYKEGPPRKFRTFRLLGRGAPNIGLGSFDGKVTVFVDPGGGAGPKTAGASLSISFDALEANGANTQPSVIPIPGGNNATIATPGISFGHATHGYMRMVGTPAPSQEAEQPESLDERGFDEYFDATPSSEYQVDQSQLDESRLDEGRFDESTVAQALESMSWQHAGAESEYEDEARRRHPQDAVKTDRWSIAFLSSVGGGAKKVGGAIGLFDLMNRETNRAHRMSISALGKTSGLPVGVSFRDSGYVKFKTRVPMSFADFHDRLARLTLKDRIGKSWRSVTVYDVDKVKELMRVEVDNWNLTGWHGFNGLGRTSIHYGNGRPTGNPDYDLKLNLPAKEDVPVGFKVATFDFGLVIRAPGDVLFDFDTDWLHYQADQTLSDIIRYINTLPPGYVRIGVEGHTDSVEKKPGYNLALSKRRAQSVLNYFTRNKWAFNRDYAFDAARGFGATKPVEPNRKPDGSDNPDGRARNRRVEIYLYRK